MPLKPANPTYKPLPRMAAQTQTHKFAIFPAPTKGLDASRPLVAQDPLTAGLLDNWWVRKWGPELRGGYERWTSNLGGLATPASVLTLMAYRSSPGAAGTYQQKLFAACADYNIYDVTSQTDESTAPAAATTVGSQETPGQFSYVNFSTGGTNYLCCVSAGGGYWTYDDAGGWVDRTASLTGYGTAPEGFDFVTIWKRRLWFVRKGTALAYYLPVDAIQGALALFDFGPLLAHGGQVSIISSWTLDSGDGLDDRMIVIGSEGDVLVYEGSDPASPTTFAMVGKWYLGKVPSGRRFASSYGGDTAIITEQGVAYMSEVLQARGLLDPESVRDTPSYRYNQIIGEEVRQSRGQLYWTLMYHPGQTATLILTPSKSGPNALQYVFNTLTQSWSTFSAVPMQCAEEFDGDFYFANEDGQVFKAFHAQTDDQLSDGTVGDTIFGSVQTAYVTDPDNPMTLKRPLLIQPMFQAPQAPQITAQINTEWSTNGTAGSPAYVIDQDSTWDTSLWDTAVWGSSEQAFFAWLGANGLGAYASLRMRVAGLPGTIFTSWKMIYEPGGVM